ncbi:hypothetical protein EP331_13555 [bacterium]|nr:MAG: hypothetical protein EP331_13555 [bacterium]
MKSKLIKPHLIVEWKLILTGILLLPVGFGVILLVIAYQKWKSCYWELFDSHIIIHTESDSYEFSLTDIVEAEATIYNSLLIKGLSSVKLKTSKASFILHAVSGSEIYVSAINEIIAHIHQEKQKEIPVREAEYDDLAIGGLDRYNDLVGLWQAGLITDEDFQSEQKKFK